MKEKHQFTPPTAAQQLQEQVLRKDEEEEDGKDDVVEVVNKSDSEIIVDDDVTKTVVPDTQPDSNSSNQIVVIDEEKPVSENCTGDTVAEIAVNGDLVKNDEARAEPIISEEPMPIDNDKEINPLKDLMLWLHDRSPLTKQELSGLCITMEDFEQALKSVQPSAKREGFASVPDVSWNDVGSLSAVREELQMAILVRWHYSIYFLCILLTDFVFFRLPSDT